LRVDYSRTLRANLPRYQGGGIWIGNLVDSNVESKNCSIAPWCGVPHHGVWPLNQMSTCITQLNSGPDLVQSWSRKTQESGPNETFVLHRVAVLSSDDPRTQRRDRPVDLRKPIRRRRVGGNNSNILKDFRTTGGPSQGPKLALSGSCVPSSLSSGAAPISRAMRRVGELGATAGNGG